MVSPPPTSADVSIVEPVMFSHVHGKVDIIGSAAGDGFVSYRLLVGQGLNPQAWIQIGDDAKKPVSNGRLGVWDVESLSGLYTIRLQVIYRSQRIETFILQVTVDNTPPNMSIEYPHDRQTLSYQTELPLVIQLNSQDELGVAKIEVYVDDSLIATLSQPPYLLPWMLMKGEHTLRVIAYDLTGNQTTDEVNFSVVE